MRTSYNNNDNNDNNNDVFYSAISIDPWRFITVFGRIWPDYIEQFTSF